MSFFKPDNNTPAADPATDNTSAVADPAMQPPVPATDDMQSITPSPAPDNTLQDSVDDSGVAPTPNNDVTVTTDEGSTLHTFNDPTLQTAPAPDDNTGAPAVDANPEFSAPDLSTATQDAGSVSDGVNDALSFQTTDDNPFATPTTEPVSDAATDTTDTSVIADDNTPGLDTTDLTAVSDDTLASSDDTEAAGFSSTPLVGDSTELDDIKKQALEQLRPLLEKVDLPAGEKFDKYLMMLRATDDPTLIQPAFNAAQGITEDKDKAEALVDIINEINYVSGETQTAQD